MGKFQFNPTDGLLNVSTYPTNPSTEQEARGQIQDPLNQLKDFINNNIINGLAEQLDTAGFKKIPGLDGKDLILQWGNTSGTLSGKFLNKSITYPTPFLVGGKVFVNCDWLSGTSSTANMKAMATNGTASGFVASFKNDDSMFDNAGFSATWFAVGY